MGAQLSDGCSITPVSCSSILGGLLVTVAQKIMGSASQGMDSLLTEGCGEVIQAIPLPSMVQREEPGSKI